MEGKAGGGQNNFVGGRQKYRELLLKNEKGNIWARGQNGERAGRGPTLCRDFHKGLRPPPTRRIL